MLPIKISYILDTPIVSFHKYDKILAADLYGDLALKISLMTADL